MGGLSSGGHYAVHRMGICRVANIILVVVVLRCPSGGTQKRQCHIIEWFGGREKKEK